MKIVIFFYIIIFSLTISSATSKEKQIAQEWSEIVRDGSNKKVFFHAWGGSKNINKYIQWVGIKIKQKYGTDLVHVKIKDTSQAVRKVLFEKIAKKNENGSIDLIWINGENFSTMLKNNLLLDKGWIFDLPNSKYINLEADSSLMYDFGIFNEGREMPWGLSQLVYFYDSKKIDNPPKNAQEINEYIHRNPGRFTFPQPPDFTGTSFLKQILTELTNNKKVLQQTFDKKKHSKTLDNLWEWLDDVTPFLWKNGKNYPKNYLALSQLLSDKEIDIGMSFNISFPSSEVLKGNLPKTIRSYVAKNGSLSNVHYLTIPYNGRNVSAAKLVINYMISPEAQLRKQDPKIWGDPTVFSFEKLDKSWRRKFFKISNHLSRVSNEDLNKKLSEPHPSWVKHIEENWIKRYGSIN